MGGRRRQSHPTPVLLPGKSHGWRSLVGCSPWVAESWTRLSDFTFTFHFHALEKEMATHSSVLAWRIPGTGSLVGCRLWGRTESDMTGVTQQQQQQCQGHACWRFSNLFLFFHLYCSQSNQCWLQVGGKHELWSQTELGSNPALPQLMSPGTSPHLSGY